MRQRIADIHRETKETSITCQINLDGVGKYEIDTGIGFLDHMLTHLSKHGKIDLTVKAKGDLNVDAHHTVEDIGLVFGDTLNKALGDRKGIKRYGHAVTPMDDALCAVTIDLSNRPYLVYQVPPLSPRVGQFETELAPEFFRAFCHHGGVTLHINVPYGNNTHHILEAVLKAWGRALDESTQIDERRKGVPSSKGAL